MRIPFLLPLLLVTALAAPARSEEGRFAVSIAGLGAGFISYEGTEKAGRYTAAGAVAATGLARALYPARIATTATGRVEGNRYRPATYRARTQKRRESTDVTFRYANGTPQVSQTPPEKGRKSHHAAPADQRGTLDPMSSAFAILRDRPAALACNLDISYYDGRERSRIRLSGGKRDGGTLTCPGVYTRVAGFSAKDMAERVNWPFTVIYTILPDGTHRVTSLTIPTTSGKVRMTRR